MTQALMIHLNQTIVRSYQKCKNLLEKFQVALMTQLQQITLLIFQNTNL